MTPRRTAAIRDKFLRFLLGGAHRLLTLGWFVRRPLTHGAHAVALTPDEKIVLVRLRYAPGWRLPGGGRRPDESPAGAVLRELREEIGLLSYGAVEFAGERLDPIDFKRDHAALLIVRDVRYRPHRWSWEVERVMEAPLDALPNDLSGRTERWLNSVRDRL